MPAFTRRPHCERCTCRPLVPSTFISHVRLLPFRLDHETVYVFKNRKRLTGLAMDYVWWEPDRHDHLIERIAAYRELLRCGDAANVREAVKMLAVKRREWEAAETASHAEWLSRQKRTLIRSGYERGWEHKKEVIRIEGGEICSYCGASGARAVDHKVPVSRGRDDRRKNLALSCVPCNSEKKNRTPEEWKAWRLAKGLPWPPPNRTANTRKVA